MSKFDRLKKHSQKGDVARAYVISYGDEAVRLYFKPATEANTDYWNEVLRRVEDKAKGRKMKLNAKTTEQARMDDAGVFASHCLVGWDETDGELEDGLTGLPMLDDKGKVIKYSESEGRAFLLSLAENVDYAFDGVRTWLTEAENFTGDAPVIKPGEASALGN